MNPSFSFLIPMTDELFEHLVRLFGGHALPAHALLGAAVGLLVLAGGKAVKFVLDKAVRRIISRTENELDDLILDIILERLIAFSGVYGLYLALEEVRNGLTKAHTTLTKLLDYADVVMYLVAALLVTSVIIKITRAVVNNVLTGIARRNNYEEAGKTLPLLVNRVASFVIIAAAAIVVLDRFGQNIGSILTILGAGSLALGLAAQDTISNMISGFIIMIDRPFRVGDRIRIPSGEVGDVFEIGLRSTKILDFDNNLVIVPNNELVKTRIVNLGYPHNEVRVVVEVSVGYGCDVDEVKRIMLAAARRHPDVLKEPEPEAYLMKLADWSLSFSLFCRVAEFKQQFKTAEALRIAIYGELTARGIEIPFPQQVVHLRRPVPHASRRRTK